MDYRSRVQLIVTEVTTFLRKFEVPPHLSDDALQGERIKDTAEIINGKIPSGASDDDIRHRISLAGRHILTTHRTSRWPAISVFSDAMDQTRPRDVSAPAMIADKRDDRDDWDHHVDVMLKLRRWRAEREGTPPPTWEQVEHEEKVALGS